MIYIILALLIIILLLVIFICKYINYNNNLIDFLKGVRKTDFNSRVRLGTNNKQYMELSDSINTLIDDFQKTSDRKNYLEDNRKRMISNISHDLRTPLTSIMGYIEILEKDNELTEEEKKKYIDIISLKSNALYKLIDDFFELSKLESNDLPIKLSYIDTAEQARQAVAMFYQDFIDSGLKLEIDIPEAPVKGYIDETKFHRVLNNIFSNTLKYAKNADTIIIKMTENDKNILLSITDNGKGISSEDIKYIFERLYTAEKSRNKSFQGSGLGLTIAKRLMQSMDGDITVSSIPDKATTFTIIIKK